MIQKQNQTNPSKKLWFILGILGIVTCGSLIILNPFAIFDEEENYEQELVIELNIPAPSLKNAFIENPDKQPFIAILPSNYNTSGKSYPVVYFLHGFSTSVSDFRSTFIYFTNHPEIIFIVVNGHHEVIGGTFYENSPITGNWEDFVVKDVVNYTDQNFRTIANPRNRWITGLSMGGYAALKIAMKYPSIFGHTYAISPGLFDEQGLTNFQINSAYIIDMILDKLQEWKSILDPQIALEEYITYMESLPASSTIRLALAYGTAFAFIEGSQNTSQIPYFTYYYERNGEDKLIRNDTIWKRWETGFGGIAKSIGNYLDNWRSLNSFCIEYSDEDSYGWIPDGCEYLATQWTEYGLNHTLIKTPYGHGNRLITRIEEYMLPYIMNLLITSD